MSQSIKTLHYQEIALCYNTYGHGHKKVIAFHGFGQDSAVFKDYAKALGENYCVYSFDLFFHGGSIWPYKAKPLEKQAWRALFKAFQEKEQIEKFSLVGFSLGGKPLLATLEGFSNEITSITLIAPDGIKPNFWYKLATTSFPFKMVFRHIINQPKLFFKTLSLLEKLNLMDKRMIHFVRSQMKTKTHREKVYYTWMVYRKFSFKMDKIAGLINQRKIPVTIYLGKSDKVITKKDIEGLLRKLWDYDLRIIPGNHNNIYKNFLKL